MIRNSVKHRAYINELYKMSGCTDRNKIFNFVKTAAYFSEIKKIDCGSGKSIIIKEASDEFYEPPKWEGISGFHKAVSEDPKKYEHENLKAALVGAALPLPVVAAQILKQNKDLERANEEYHKGFFKVRNTAKETAIIKNIVAKNTKLFAPISAAALIGGIMFGPKIVKGDYLESRGIKKGLLSGYKFNDEAKQKYLKGGSMEKVSSYLDRVKRLTSPFGVCSSKMIALNL